MRLGKRSYLIQNGLDGRFKLRSAWIKDDPFRKGQNQMVGLTRYTYFLFTILIIHNRSQIDFQRSEYSPGIEIRNGGRLNLNRSFFGLYRGCRLGRRMRSGVFPLEGHSKKEDEKDHEEKEEITQGPQPEILSFLNSGLAIPRA